MTRLKNKVLLTVLSMVCGVILSMPIPAKAASLYWPVPGHTSLSQGFHDGKAIDISDGSISGADVIAAMGGNVTAIFLCPTQHYGSSGDCNGFGTGVVIKGDDGRFYQYAHMQGGSVPANVYYGAYVSAGQKVGKVGTTGNSSGNHLHFGISTGSYGNWSGINPQNESYIYSGPHTHAYAWSVTKQPTCTENGVKTFRCSCGASYTEAVSAKGHQYVNKTVAPTMTEKGYTSHTCSACGNSYKDNYVESPRKSEDGWYYSVALPQGISAEQYEIQYQNYYEKIQKDSPGNDWKNAGVAKNEWQNSGGQYTSVTDLPTSDARVLVHAEYYHFCGPNAGNEGNYDLIGKFVHYDGVSADRVTAKYLGTDNGHPYYFIYWKDGGAQISCQSGVTCDGSYGSHGNRCRAWYKTNTYQDRVNVVQYKFTKTSDWTAARDLSASSVKVRFKELVPEITEPEITGSEVAEPEITEPEITEPEITESKVTEPEKTESETTESEPEKTEPDVTKPETSEPVVTQPETIEQTITQPEPTKPVATEPVTENPTVNKVQKPSVSKVSSLSVTAYKKKLKISWKKVSGAAGYQIQIFTAKNFSGAKTIAVSSSKKAYTKSGLKAKKKYYVRIRAYKTYRDENGYTKKAYGSWVKTSKKTK